MAAGRRAGALAVLVAVAAMAAPAGAPAASWYAGDDHVHTCFSHDAYCGPDDDNTGPDTAYSSGGTVAQRFAEAAAKGLDFLIVSDHDDVRAQSDPAFGSQGVAAVPAYEASLAGGHAHMLGATHLYPEGDTTEAAGVRALADALRADGGRFQANHPSYKDEAPFDSCDQADGPDPGAIPLHWKYGFSVEPDSIEVWNATTLLQPAELYWECWLQRGVRVGGTAGSDSHGATQPNIGLPTTWVLADSLRPGDVLGAIAAGRTTLSRTPPALGGVRLLLEGDADRDGRYESAIGDEVPPGTPLRVRADGPAPPALVRVRANGETVVDGAAPDARRDGGPAGARGGLGAGDHVPGRRHAGGGPGLPAGRAADRHLHTRPGDRRDDLADLRRARADGGAAHGRAVGRACRDRGRGRARRRPASARGACSRTAPRRCRPFRRSGRADRRWPRCAPGRCAAADPAVAPRECA